MAEPQSEVAARPFLVAGALFGLLGVACGAFGAHGLKATLGPEALGWWQTAAQYQMWHALALVALGLGPLRARAAGWLFGAGILLFSGSLYLMALTGLSALAIATPLGGLLLILGWAALALAAVRARG